MEKRNNSEQKKKKKNSFKQSIFMRPFCFGNEFGCDMIETEHWKELR